MSRKTKAVYGAIFLFAQIFTSLLLGETKTWVTSGYEDFAAGTFDAGGYNLYVSRAGNLQMISNWDVNNDGNIDFFYGNSHDGIEYMPALIYLQRDGILSDKAVIELPSQHSRTQCISDLNGDGYNDIIVVNDMVVPAPVTRTYIYWGGPEGLGAKYRTSIPTFLPQRVVAGDLNGDGLKEIIVANARRERFDLEGGRISIYWQTEPGRFPLDRREDLISYNGRALDVADADGDGIDDLVFHGRSDPSQLSSEALTILTQIGSSQDGDNLYIIYGKQGGHEAIQPLPVARERQGTPRFLRLRNKSHLALTTGSAIEIYPFVGRKLAPPIGIAIGGVSRISVADVNGDGVEDLVCHRGSKIDILLGDAQGYDPARKQALEFEATDAVAGDVTGDGRPDIVAAVFKEGDRYAAMSRIYVNGPDGLKDNRYISLRTHGATEVQVSDLDHDGKNDVSFSCSEGGHTASAPPVRVYLGTKDNSEGRYVDLPAISAYGGFMADFNDDGFTDLLVANEYETQGDVQNYWFIYLGSNQGLSADRVQQVPSSKGSKYPIVADFNHDGYLDVAMGRDDGMSYLCYGGKEGFQPEKRMEMPIGEQAVDINKDGWLDILAYLGDKTRTMSIYLGDPTGFDLKRKLDIPMYGGGHMDVADLDGNGWLDLIMGSGGDAREGFSQTYTRSSIWWGSDRGYSASRCTELALEQGSREVAVADLNKDGYLDIVMSAYNQGIRRIFPAYILWGNKDNAYSVENSTALLQGAPLGIQIADGNHDGWPDISFCNHNPGGNSNTLSRIYWNHKGRFSDSDMTLVPTTGAHNSIKPDLGNLYTRKLEEAYTSVAFQRPSDRQFKKLSWTAVNKFGTSVVFQVRSAETRERLNTAVWAGPQGSDSYFIVPGASLKKLPKDHAWIQYRAILRTPDGAASPRLTRVEVEY